MPRLPVPPVSSPALWSQRLAFFSSLVVILGVLIVRMHSVPLAPALTVLASGICLASVALILAIAGFVGIWRSGAGGLGSAYLGFALALLLLAYPAYLAERTLMLPAITDISSDAADPPEFSVTRQAAGKRDGLTPQPYRGAFAAAQKAAYPHIQPVVLQSSVEESYRLVMEAIQPLRWTLIDASPPQRAREEASIEAVDRSPVLRLPESIIIRIRPYGQETRIDFRSASLVGGHDFGSNARRIANLIDAISDLARER